MAERRGDRISRRRTIESLSAATVAGLAGCQGDSDSGSGTDLDTETGGTSRSSGGELGERVPEPITVEYYANISWTPYQEAMAPVMTESLQELLGFTVDVRPVTAGTMIENVIEDKRDSHFSFFS